MSTARREYQLSEDLLAPVLAILDSYQDPYLLQGLVSAGIVTKLDIDGKRLLLGLCYPYPCQSQYRDRVMAITKKLAELDAIDEVECEIDFNAPAICLGAMKPLANIKQIIAIASGKGGVGKSTTAVNLALALASEGAKVGILDADIYGPSIPIMLGVTEFKPVSSDGKTMGVASAHNIVAQSIGFMIGNDNAAIWRGPMAAGALLQLLNDTLWPELDYLVVDLPPGTGDIQLTLAQQIPVSGAVIVTTPQDVALADAKKAINMFQKVNIPVVGIIENMSYYLCDKCSHKEYLFGQDGGAQMATRYQLPLLGQLPLDLKIRQDVDAGQPTVVADADGPLAQKYRAIARALGAQLALIEQSQGVAITIADDE